MGGWGLFVVEITLTVWVPWLDFSLEMMGKGRPTASAVKERLP